MKITSLIVSAWLYFICMSSVKGQYVYLINKGLRATHCSYEDKTGKIKGVRIKTGISTIAIDGPTRITFDHLLTLYPFILYPGDSLTVSLSSSSGPPTFTAKNYQDLYPHQVLEEKYQILKSPFTGIEYSKKTNYTAVRQEIERFRTQRKNYIGSLHLSPLYQRIYSEQIAARYVDELQAPFHKFSLDIDFLPSDYIQVVDSAVDSLFRLVSQSKSPSLIRHYVGSAVAFKCRATYNTPNQYPSQYNYISKVFTGKLKEYLHNKLLLKAQEEGKQVQSLVDDFVKNCQNADYRAYFTSRKVEYQQLTQERTFLNTPLINVLGDTITWQTLLKNQKNKVIFLDFWASWCVPCLTEMPHAKRLIEKLPANVAILFISIDTDLAKWQASMVRLGLGGSLATQSFVLSPSSHLAEQILKGTVPKYVIINKAGEIVTTDGLKPSDTRTASWLMSLL